jgi:protein-tyrosine phosphatase/arsenate reductase
VFLKGNNMFEKIQNQCEVLVQQFDSISLDRKAVLLQLSDYIHAKIDSKLLIQLMYVCTHNSRRSHFGQIWSAVAADFYSIPQVSTFSGGTESTAFHPNAIQALTDTGFEIFSADSANENPRYTVQFGENQRTVCFSKVYDDSVNPTNAFAAIMTCSDAEENCPFIPGVELRVGTTYDDPKAFDGTVLQSEKYMERSNQIALETLFVFSNLKNKL